MTVQTKKYIAVLISIIMLLSCGPVKTRKDLQNLPSLIEIMALNVQDQTLKLRISHRNNSARLENQLSCQLALKDQSPIQINSLKIPDLTTYAVETIETKLDLSTLNIDINQHDQLSYVLDCFLFSSTFRREHIIAKSIIYQTPGELYIYR